jgi:hypothetical protein
MNDITDQSNYEFKCIIDDSTTDCLSDSTDLSGCLFTTCYQIPNISHSKKIIRKRKKSSFLPENQKYSYTVHERSINPKIKKIVIETIYYDEIQSVLSLIENMWIKISYYLKHVYSLYSDEDERVSFLKISLDTASSIYDLLMSTFKAIGKTGQKAGEYIMRESLPFLKLFLYFLVKVFSFFGVIYGDPGQFTLHVLMAELPGLSKYISTKIDDNYENIVKLMTTIREAVSNYIHYLIKGSSLFLQKTVGRTIYALGSLSADLIVTGAKMAYNATLGRIFERVRIKNQGTMSDAFDKFYKEIEDIRYIATKGYNDAILAVKTEAVIVTITTYILNIFIYTLFGSDGFQPMSIFSLMGQLFGNIYGLNLPVIVLFQYVILLGMGSLWNFISYKSCINTYCRNNTMYLDLTTGVCKKNCWDQGVQGLSLLTAPVFLISNFNSLKKKYPNNSYIEDIVQWLTKIEAYKDGIPPQVDELWLVPELKILVSWSSTMGNIIGLAK